MIIAKDGTMISCSGNYISCSSGETYILSGNVLTGSNGFVSYNVNSISEAIGIVTGIHGGKMC